MRPLSRQREQAEEWYLFPPDLPGILDQLGQWYSGDLWCQELKQN